MERLSAVLKPGDTICDRSGNHVLTHEAHGVVVQSLENLQAFWGKLMRQEVDVEEYIATMCNRQAILDAYQHDGALPPGAVILPMAVEAGKTEDVAVSEIAA